LNRGTDSLAIGTNKGDRLLGNRIVIHFKKHDKPTVVNASGRHKSMITTFKGDNETPVCCRIEKAYHWK
jgi:hypothetical protein